MKVGVIGLGNMGAAVAAAILDHGGAVYAYDIDAVRLQQIAEGEVFGETENTKEIIRQGVRDNRLIFVDSLKSLENCDLNFIGVPTPEAEFRCDYRILLRVLSEYSVLEKKPSLLIGSTVFPGAFKNELRSVLANLPEVIYQPVFLRFGHGREDYLHPGKIIFGEGEPKSESPALQSYLHLLGQSDRSYFRLSYEKAEWIKLIHNAFMCLKINFSNEMNLIFKDLGDDYSATLQEILTNASFEFFANIHHATPTPFAGLDDLLRSAVQSHPETVYFRQSMLKGAFKKFEALSVQSFNEEVESFYQRYDVLFKKIKSNPGRALLILFGWELLVYRFRLEFQEVMGLDHEDFDEVWAATFNEESGGRLLTPSHMRPGMPFAGPCLPKDARVLFGLTDTGSPLLQSLHQSNEAYKDYLYAQWYKMANNGKLGLLGFSFRPGALEFRQSAGLEFFERAQKNFDHVYFSDEYLKDVPQQKWEALAKQDPDVLKAFEFFKSPEELIESSDSILLLAEPSAPLKEQLQNRPTIKAY